MKINKPKYTLKYKTIWKPERNWGQKYCSALHSMKDQMNLMEKSKAIDVALGSIKFGGDFVKFCGLLRIYEFY